MAQPRRAKSRGPSGTHVALVPSIAEKAGTDLLPHDEEGRGTSLPASVRFLDGKRRCAHAAIPIPCVHQLFFPLHNKTHPLRSVSVHGVLLTGSPSLAVCQGTRRAIQRQISILSYKTSSSSGAEGQTCSGVSSSAPPAKSIWLGRVPAAATGGITNKPVTLSIYTCRGFGPFPQAWQGPRLMGPSILPGSREIGVTLPM